MILGRFLTLIIRDVLILKVENLGSYSSIHLLSGRTDLACHDSYSLTCGVFVVLILFYLIKNGMSWISLLAFKMNTLQRRNAIRRPQQEHVREEQEQEGQEESPGAQALPAALAMLSDGRGAPGPAAVWRRLLEERDGA